MESYVLPENITAELLAYIYLFPGSITLTDAVTWDGYRVIDSDYIDRKHLRNKFPGIVI
jgi:hypothetical protein